MSVFVWTGINYSKAETLCSLLQWDSVPITLKTPGRESWQIAPSQIDLEVDDKGIDGAVIAYFSDAFEYKRRTTPEPEHEGKSSSDPAPALGSVDDFELEIDEEASEESFLDYFDHAMFAEIDAPENRHIFAQACSIVRGLDAHEDLFAPGDAVCVHNYLDWDSVLVANYASAFGARVFYHHPSLLYRRCEMSVAPMIPGPNEPEFMTLFRRHRSYEMHSVKACAAFAHRTGNGSAFRGEYSCSEASKRFKRHWNPEESYDVLIIGQADSDPELVLAEELEFRNTREMCIALASDPELDLQILYRPAEGETLDDLRALEPFENVYLAPANLRDFIGRVGRAHVLSSSVGAEMQLMGFSVVWQGHNWYRFVNLGDIPSRFRFFSFARRYFCTIDNLYDNVMGRMRGSTRRPLIPGQHDPRRIG